MVAPSPLGFGLIARKVTIETENVALLRYILEAHEGLGLMYGEGDGLVTLLAPQSQEAGLLELIADLTASGLLTPCDEAAAPPP